MIGARNVQQLEESVKALDIYKTFTPEIDARIESILGNRPPTGLDWRKWVPLPSRR
jgi:aryl-alcohol dehydrogenase-like predicted oxidoreductase